MAITSFTDGYTFMMVCVSGKALSRSSSLGRTVEDQVDAELARRLLGPAPATDEVRIALGLRHHGNHKAPLGGARGYDVGWTARGRQRAHQPDVRSRNQHGACEDRSTEDRHL